MKIFLAIISVVLLSSGYAQLSDLNLNNALVIGQLDKPEDRFSVEINVSELLSNNRVKAMPSLNVLKLGSNSENLGADSIQKLVQGKGIDTYLIIYVRGYDKKFKPTTRKDDLQTALAAGSLFPIYREEVTSVTFEFLFYKNGQFVAADIVRCKNVSSRDSVLKKLRKALEKRIVKKWK
ncbi:MAG: hypothetical protein EP305_11235 [Bacteroidetes bacterium]|nr:MAG: hypothetical protein EP305_11235 [Bacteroidota bacterium]